MSGLGKCSARMAVNKKPFNPPSSISMNLDIASKKPVMPEESKPDEQDVEVVAVVKGRTNQVHSPDIEILVPPAYEKNPQYRFEPPVPPPSIFGSQMFQQWMAASCDPKASVVQSSPPKKILRIPENVEEGPMPLFMIMGLAMLNAGKKSLGIQEIYRWFITHFKKLTAENEISVKARIKKELSRYRFTSMALSGMHTKYALNLTESNWLMEGLNYLEKKREWKGTGPDWYGLVNESVWEDMKAGTLGISEIQKNHADGNHKKEPMGLLLMTGLALLNAGEEPLELEKIHNFLITHFTKCTPDNYGKGNVKAILSRHYHYFTKVEGPGICVKYRLNLTKSNWVVERLKRLENMRIVEGADLRSLGLVDESVWDSMKAGTLGLPPVQPIDKKRKYGQTQIENREEASSKAPPVTSTLLQNMNPMMYQPLFPTPTLPWPQMNGHLMRYPMVGPFMQMKQFPLPFPMSLPQMYHRQFNFHQNNNGPTRIPDFRPSDSLSQPSPQFLFGKSSESSPKPPLSFGVARLLNHH